MPESRKIVKNVLRIAIVAIVIWGIARAFRNAQTEFVDNELSWGGFRWWWLVVSAVIYSVGLSAMGCFWFVTLRALKQRPEFWRTIRAYWIGHLGKYVPGKAMVIVLRTGLIGGERVDTVTATIAVFIETLTSMSVGAFLAGVVILTQFREHRLLMWAAGGTMLLTLLPTLPPLFCLIVHRLRPQYQNHFREITSGYTYRLVAIGWLASLVSWCCLSLSLWATLRAIPYADAIGPLDAMFPLYLAAVTLAVVLGFASLLPGGIGVREWVFSGLLAPKIGHLAAFSGTIVVRLVWLVTEIVVSIILYLVVPAETESIPPEGTPPQPPSDS